MKFENFKSFLTSSKKKVIFAKNAKQNEQLMKLKKNSDIILHTEQPGSPFCIIRGRDIKEKDIEETAIVCACFSQQWKKREKTAKVSVFFGKDVYKKKNDKIGTFHVKKIRKTLNVKLELWIGLQKGKLKALPKRCLEKIFLKIAPGKIEKEKVAEKISKLLKKFNIEIPEEEIKKIIPAGGFSILNFKK